VVNVRDDRKVTDVFKFKCGERNELVNDCGWRPSFLLAKVASVSPPQLLPELLA
jgi:hypothetical protein